MVFGEQSNSRDDRIVFSGGQQNGKVPINSDE